MRIFFLLEADLHIAEAEAEAIEAKHSQPPTKSVGSSVRAWYKCNLQQAYLLYVFNFFELNLTSDNRRAFEKQYFKGKKLSFL